MLITYAHFISRHISFTVRFYHGAVLVCVIHTVPAHQLIYQTRRPERAANLQNHRSARASIHVLFSMHKAMGLHRA